jgi:stage II sporulation protein D
MTPVIRVQAHDPVMHEPFITVGIIDRRAEVSGRLNGRFAGCGAEPFSGTFSAFAEEGSIVLTDETCREITRAFFIRLTADTGSTFTLFGVTIGNRFHWERSENQTFCGNLILRAREDGTITAINEVLMEEYLKSVISSEMSAGAPAEFLKAHAIMSRSWLMAALERKKNSEGGSLPATSRESEGEVIRWYDREEHDLFDVCADDHCQRYQGITKINSEQAEQAGLQTRGIVMMHQNEICDTRYSKACGGLTEDFETAWDDKGVPYLKSVSDAAVAHAPVSNEEDASRWITSAPEAYCHTEDKALLERILPDFDRETTRFFRWRIDYPRTELEEIVRRKSGLDFGTLQEIIPISRGPSGRISRLRITGSKRSMIVGKELEIRRWLSPSHLYSSAFIVTAERGPDEEVETFTFHGAGWGHGVGLCQIGAAVMAAHGFKADEILKHYFRGVELQKIY